MVMTPRKSCALNEGRRAGGPLRNHYFRSAAWGSSPSSSTHFAMRSMRMISTVDGFVAVGPSLRSHQENMESNFTRFCTTYTLQ